MKVKDQVVTDNYSIYNADCVEAISAVPDESIGFSIFSPPFADLYSYSDDDEDMGNCGDYKGFFEHFKFLTDEFLRVMMPGRIVAVHCMDLPTYKRNGEEIGMKDFSGDLIRRFQKSGFIFHSRHCVWKNPLVAATRTKAIGLAHKQIVKDSALCRMGIPDYVLGFRKPGENPKPISNVNGLSEYFGQRTVPRELDRFMKVNPITGESWKPKENKRSHWIWQQYASPVWMDIRQTRVLEFRNAKDEDDQKHICPLQLDLIERCMALWSAPGDVVLSPFMGIGSEIYVAVKNGRKGVGIELKGKYFKQARKHLKGLDTLREGGRKKLGEDEDAE